MKKFLITTLLLVFSIIQLSAQVNTNRKKMGATRIEKAPKIDGILDDEAWKNAKIAKDFIMMRPDNGKAEVDTHKTEVKLVYDDDAIYISALMYDPDPTKIPAEFTSRDNFGNADFFMVMVNPIDDGQNPNMFIVSAAGVQTDSKVSNGNEDYNWNGVWESGFKINKDSWTVEIRIPYRALRFSNKPIQSWGFNFHRDIKNLNARYTWNHIDNQQGRWTQYDGLVENFRDIKPPTRLSFYPYASVISNTFDGHTTGDWSAGMDLKYGLTENFTLDATLIPDFSQAGFDNVELNLGPFEQRFSEQRQFFTEGTELFTKGRLFYSRRIGASPTDQFDVESQLTTNEVITDSPGKVDMLNAVKISGRTKKGLGIGFFNAITAKTEAKVRDTLTGNTRELVTNPFTNYNIMVLDQQFNQNSSVSLINTNVTRDGKFRDANATALDWHIEDKGSNYNIDGSFKMTNISDDPSETNTGYSFDTSIGKQSGKWRGEIGYNFENKDYNPNDLGILFSNNEQTLYGFLGYRILKPTGNINNGGITLYYNVNWLHNPGTYTGTNVGIGSWFNTKGRFNFGGNLNFSSKGRDFFEPRQGSTSGVFFETPLRFNVNHWGNTDRRKKLSFNYFWYYTFFKNNPRENYGFRIAPRYRFNNQFSLSYSFRYNQSNDEQGYVNEVNNDIIFGQRDRGSYENSISGKYTFSPMSSLSLTFRHNWTKVPYDTQFYNLTSEGLLTPNNYSDMHDVNFNSWNLDLNYIWQFAPGSQLIAFYRNSIFSQNDNTNPNFFQNLENLFEEPNQHIFSLRLVYFIDYNNIKNIF
ncbi:carbohydrate binding protein with CBM9 domain [Lutibacter sp. Hel_I_33_5]|uniref:DUF5916 domain-containing protein n=1 Tax=Lutibacter sp. Hel_I_33_5 TaxID=1566289 RepID=UPI0011A39AC9|nr:DUF5916 domain-containing protein [Lutibacter sp. Hel_I_33_5]TVZ55283.1 carbohydrate binding protein with CBM9 domain [Lutibacter sp. Hel_I_33_5]